MQRCGDKNEEIHPESSDLERIEFAEIILFNWLDDSHRWDFHLGFLDTSSQACVNLEVHPDFCFRMPQTILFLEQVANEEHENVSIVGVFKWQTFLP